MTINVTIEYLKIEMLHRVVAEMIKIEKEYPNVVVNIGVKVG